MRDVMVAWVTCDWDVDRDLKYTIVVESTARPC